MIVTKLLLTLAVTALGVKPDSPGTRVLDSMALATITAISCAVQRRPSAPVIFQVRRRI